MNVNELERYREIIPDEATSGAIVISLNDKQTLNNQSGFNRALLKKSNMCGCFHCGRTFPSHLVVSWLQEPGEEDTGLCPYCGSDALIAGTEKHPLSTALLSILYQEWFDEEHDERKESATEVPIFAGYDDYFRQGIPFRWRQHPDRTMLAEINIWSFGSPEEDCLDCAEAIDFDEFPLGGVWNFHAWEEKVYDDPIVDGAEELDDGKTRTYRVVDEHFELERDGVTIPVSPWTEQERSLAIFLSSTYGNALRAIFKDYSMTMYVCVDESE